MGNHFRKFSCSRCKIDQKLIAGFGRFNIITRKFNRSLIHQALITIPTILICTNTDEIFQSRAFTANFVNLGNIFMPHDGRNRIRLLHPVFTIVRCQNIRSRHRHNTQLGGTQHYCIPLNNPGHHDKNAIPLFQTFLAQNVGKLVAQTLHVEKTVLTNITQVRAGPDHSQLGAILSPLINDIKTEVEKLGDIEFKIFLNIIIVLHIGTIQINRNVVIRCRQLHNYLAP